MHFTQSEVQSLRFAGELWPLCMDCELHLVIHSATLLTSIRKSGAGQSIHTGVALGRIIFIEYL